MNIELKNGDLSIQRCPFCASRAVRISNTHTACYTVACDDCGGEITGESCEKTWKSARAKIAGHLTAIRNATEKWNKRAFEFDDEPGMALLESTILWGTGAKFVNYGGTFGLLGASTE
jgi:hypothetical protein